MTTTVNEATVWLRSWTGWSVTVPRRAVPGDLLVFFAGVHRYQRVVDGTEPAVFAAPHARAGQGPAGWDRTDRPPQREKVEW